MVEKGARAPAKLLLKRPLLSKLTQFLRIYENPSQCETGFLFVSFAK